MKTQPRPRKKALEAQIASPDVETQDQASQEPELVPIEESDKQIIGIDDGKKSLANIAPEISLSLAKTELSREQVLSIRSRTPRSMNVERGGKIVTVPIVKKVKIGGGKEADYVPVAYYIRKLNYTFGYDGWNFDVTKEEVVEDQALVKGVLTVYLPNGREIRKTSFGGHPIAREIVAFEKSGMRKEKFDFYKSIKREEQGEWVKVYGHFVDVGNSFKAAGTDCLKKCASMFGFFSDIYAPDDFVEIKEEKAGTDAIIAIIGKADAKSLRDIATKLKTSDKYSSTEKESILTLIDARMKTLPDGEPVK
jgi:hypothetical protein